MILKVLDDDILVVLDCNDHVIDGPKPIFELSPRNLDEYTISNSSICFFFISFHNGLSFDYVWDPLSSIPSYDVTLIVLDDVKDRFLEIPCENTHVLVERIENDDYFF